MLFFVSASGYYNYSQQRCTLPPYEVCCTATSAYAYAPIQCINGSMIAPLSMLHCNISVCLYAYMLICARAYISEHGWRRRNLQRTPTYTSATTYMLYPYHTVCLYSTSLCYCGQPVHNLLYLCLNCAGSRDKYFRCGSGLDVLKRSHGARIKTSWHGLCYVRALACIFASHYCDSLSHSIWRFVIVSIVLTVLARSKTLLVLKQTNEQRTPQ